MLRLTPSKNVEQAKSYYTEGLAREDYYTEGQEIVGRWGGRGAERLGLYEKVEQRAFAELVENRHPKTGRRLTARHQDRRRVGYDFNFHCPKSVSVLQAITGDREIVEVFRESVLATMEEMEREMKTRVRGRGREHDRVTGNMVWADFVHFTARPVEGAPDPHLHAHLYVVNATYDPVEARWKAGQFGDLKRDAPYFEAVFHARFARALRDRGYPIRATDLGWEIDGIDDETLRKFSRRTEGIEALAAERGIVDPAAKDRLGAATRENKRKGEQLADLRQEWLSRLTADERGRLDFIHRRLAPASSSAPWPVECVRHATDHLLERRSVVRERALLTEALWHGIGTERPEEVLAQRDFAVKSGLLLVREWKGERLATTPQVLREERAMLDFVRKGRGACRPFCRRPERLFSKEPPDEEQNAKKLILQALKRQELNEEQRDAVQHILGSRDRVIAVRGVAGSGKTTLMKEARKELQKRGTRVLAFAPTAEASRGVLRSEGFKKAETVHRLLHDKELQKQVRGELIWIDEAGLLGTRTLARVFEVAEETNARVLLTGDPGQHRSVERGDAFRLLEEEAGLKAAHVGRIVRQRGAYREAVTQLAQGDVERGIETLDGLGAIEEMPAEECHQEAARRYLESVEQGRSALIVSPTHREGEEVTRSIRSEMRDAGRLAPAEKERKVPILRNLAWTEAQRADARQYEAGMVVRAHRAVEGLRAGERAEVLGAAQQDGEDRVQVRLASGEEKALPLRQAERFQVYQPTEIALAPGDLVRITQNGTTKSKSLRGKPHRLHNGSLHRLDGFTAMGHLRLGNGWVVDRDFAHLAHGYCVTSHAAQGKTVDRVVVVQSALSRPAASQEQFYVSASRGRESVTILTDDKEALLASVRRSGERMGATELMREEPQPSLRQRMTERLQALRRHVGLRHDTVERRVGFAPGQSVTRDDDRSGRTVGQVAPAAAPAASNVEAPTVQRTHLGRYHGRSR